MRLHYKGKYDLDPSSLPQGEHQPNAVPFKEAKDTRTLGLIANGIAIGIIVVLYAMLLLRGSAAMFTDSIPIGIYPKKNKTTAKAIVFYFTQEKEKISASLIRG